MSQAAFLTNSSGGGGTVTSLTAGTGITLTPSPITSTGSIALTVPVTVPDGGTGDTSFTAFAPIVGGTTSTGALQSADTGIATSGFVLTSTGSSSLPTWQASGGGGITTLATGSGNATGSTVTVTTNDGNLFPNASGSNLFLDFSNNINIVGTLSTGATITISAGSLKLPNTNIPQDQGSIYNSTEVVFHTFGATAGVGDNNIYVGANAGNQDAGGTNNSALGADIFDNLDSSSAGSFLTAVGSQALLNLVNGSNNLALGYNAGTAYVGAESSNIVIANIGTVSESNVLRIGTQGSGTGQQNQCFIAGIIGVTTSNTNVVTINTSTGQMGSAPSASLSTYTAVSTTPYVVLSTDVYLGVNSSGGVRTVELPNSPATGRVFTIKDSTGSAATNNITVTTVGGSVTIDGATSFVMSTIYESINVIFNGTSYEIY